MKQKILYSIIVILLGALVWQQMYRTPTEEAPVRTIDTQENTATSASETERGADEVGEDVASELAEEVVTVTGTYVGLRDEVGGDFADTSMYLLLDDGTEIISIDLRPLVGTQKTGIESELGISRGDRLELTGMTESGVFVVSGVVVVEGE